MLLPIMTWNYVSKSIRDKHNNLEWQKTTLQIKKLELENKKLEKDLK